MSIQPAHGRVLINGYIPVSFYKAGCPLRKDGGPSRAAQPRAVQAPWAPTRSDYSQQRHQLCVRRPRAGREHAAAEKDVRNG